MADHNRERLSISHFGRAFRGEHYSGDMVYLDDSGDSVTFAIVDAAGHGRPAFEIGYRIKTLLKANRDKELSVLVAAIHELLQGGAGAVALVGHLNKVTLDLSYIQIGDTHGKIFGRDPRSLARQDGMFGHSIPTPKLHHDTLSSGDIMVLCTDGISVRFELAEISGYRALPADRLAQSVVAQFGKHHDDATCVVWRCQ